VSDQERPAGEPVEAEAPGAADLVVVLPVYNDWRSLAVLLERLDDCLARAGEPAVVVVVDDGSIEPGDPPASPGGGRAIRDVRVVRLRRNVGHQRAIAVGLALVADRLDPPMVAVMDSDGEDDPADLPLLVSRCRAEGLNTIVFAARGRRSESFAFRAFYALYKILFLILTGRSIRFGNFSVVPRRRLGTLTCVSELWNHYAAAVLKAKLPIVAETTRRGRRLAGRSRMNFVDLVIHGLSAISVFSEVVGVRLLIASMALMAASLVGIVVVVAIRLFTELAIIGWASTIVGNLTILFMQAAMLSGVFVFVVLGARATIGLMPRDHYAQFIAAVERPGENKETSNFHDNKFTTIRPLD